ncbi:MAG: right-handed parallel beta-helix repeat-containing protein [Deltaproteobacteria bacterium]|nr:right-handed parallel beta-helix repeat-containing protein [Deltaproteobacteria bacterium]
MLASAAGCGDDDDGSSGTVTLRPSADDQTAFQTAFVEAQTGDTILIEPGTYRFTTELTLTTHGVTLRGTGPDVVLDFAMQDSGGNAIKVTGDDFTIENLTVKNTPGDGVVVDGTTNATFRGLTVSWDAGSVEENGAYAIYPINVTNVLVENCEVVGASDAGIYVGQSRNIIVRNNVVHGNVAGIEIENSTGADVYDNETYDNTAGILVFNLPNLPVKDGRRARIYGNQVRENNRDNFAIPGNIVAAVPRGTGILILAADETEIFDNDIEGNLGAGILQVGWETLEMFVSGGGADDPQYDLYPETTYIYDNRFDGNGTSPGSPFDLFGLTSLEAIVWDGLVDTAGLMAGTKDNAMGQLDLCIGPNMGATFMNLDAANGFMNISRDTAPHDCTHDNLSPIVLNPPAAP